MVLVFFFFFSFFFFFLSCLKQRGHCVSTHHALLRLSVGSDCSVVVNVAFKVALQSTDLNSNAKCSCCFFSFFFFLLHISMHPYSLHLFQEYTTVCAHTSWNSKNSEQHRNGQLSEQRKQFFHAVSNILKTVTLLVHAGIVWRFRTLPHSGMDYRIFNVRRRYFCMCIQLEGLKFFLICLLLPLAVMFRGLLEWTTKDIKVVTFCAALFPALRQTLCTLIACDSK